MVFQQAAPTRADVVTYLEGRASGYTTYDDYGDVIIFRRPIDPVPVIHRAIMYVTLHYANRTADVPALARLPLSDWSATNNAGATTTPYDLREVTIYRMGWLHNLNITFDFASPNSGIVDRAQAAYRDGRPAVYITMGDNNAPFYDLGWFPVQQDIVGRARGEIPWFGLVTLTLTPTDSCCSAGWGDTRAPKNSWDSLLVSLIFLFALPFILEYAMRGWAKYVSPRLPEIRWPWKRRTEPAAANGDPPEEETESSDRESDD
jgi:signal peptidase